MSLAASAERNISVLKQIGRNEKCDLVVKNAKVSRWHCYLKKENNQWVLYDESSNGTPVNGMRFLFGQYVTLEDGDVINLGKCYYRFEEQRSSADIDISMTTEFSGEATQSSSSKLPIFSHNPPVDKTLRDIAEKLTCMDCSELMVDAVTLNCSHTFCRFCVEQRKDSCNNYCCICCGSITGYFSCSLLNEIIEKIVEEQSEAYKARRIEIVNHRMGVSSGGSDEDEQCEHDDESILDSDVSLEESSEEDESETECDNSESDIAKAGSAWTILDYPEGVDSDDYDSDMDYVPAETIAS